MPPLLLLHTPAIGASEREMQYIMSPLARTYRVYALDLLGFGHSDRPGVEYSAAMYGELCQDFLREVIKEQATLLASRLSYNYAIAVAAAAPNADRHHIFIDPASHGSDRAERAIGSPFSAPKVDMRSAPPRGGNRVILPRAQEN